MFMQCKLKEGGGEGGTKVPGKVPVPGRPANLNNSRARAYCAFSRCRWVVWTFFLSSIFPLFYLPLLETIRNRLKYCLKGPLNQKQPTNQLN